jgi:hypothetical protein
MQNGFRTNLWTVKLQRWNGLTSGIGAGILHSFILNGPWGSAIIWTVPPAKNGQPLAKSTLRAILSSLREFILWLSQQNGFRSRIRAADADYFNLSRRDEAEARAALATPRAVRRAVAD